MDVDFIPVVVERAVQCGSPAMPTLKLKVPANMTMLQFVDKIRARLILPSVQPLHLVLERGSSVAMSHRIDRVHRDNRSESGLLHLTCATENTFGCIPPHPKPVKAKFPGDEALPFGAPEPNFEAYENANIALPAVPLPVQAFVQQGQMHGAIVHLHGTTNTPTFQFFNIMTAGQTVHHIVPHSVTLDSDDSAEMQSESEEEISVDLNTLTPLFIANMVDESSSDEM